MAKTIMISNDVYEKLKAKKENKSFTEIIKNLLNTKNAKKGSGLRECLGIIKDDKERKGVDVHIKGDGRVGTKNMFRHRCYHCNLKQ